MRAGKCGRAHEGGHMRARLSIATARAGAWLPLVLSAALLAGCEGETQELQAWMEQQRREVRPRVQPLAAPKKFDPVPYGNAQ